MSPFLVVNAACKTPEESLWGVGLLSFFLLVLEATSVLPGLGVTALITLPSHEGMKGCDCYKWVLSQKFMKWKRHIWSDQFYS